MTEAIIVLAAVVVLLLILREREQSRHEEAAIEERVAHRAELAALLAIASQERTRHDEALQILCERIQHPERVQVPPQPYEPVEVPRDASEHAWVGEMVPDFVDVGTPNGEEPPSA